MRRKPRLPRPPAASRSRADDPGALVRAAYDAGRRLGAALEPLRRRGGPATASDLRQVGALLVDVFRDFESDLRRRLAARRRSDRP